jgi:hypothetical protein
MKFLLKTIPLTLFVAFILCGATCQHTQNILYQTTDAVGNGVDKAMQAFSGYEVTKAQQALGATARQSELQAWVLADPTWQSVSQKHAQYLLAYRAWTSANAAVAAAGTNGVAINTLEFQTAAISAATDLTTMIAGFIPSVQIVR